MNGVAKICCMLLLGLSWSSSLFAAAGDNWKVVVPVGNARSFPFTDADLIVQLPQGTSVQEVSRQGSWLEVLTPEGEQVWMHQVTLKPSQGLELFGVDITQAKRVEMRQAISKSPVIVVREADNYLYDLYDPSQWLTGATEMTFGYTSLQQEFVVAEITFRSNQDTEQVRKVAEAVKLELGPWHRVLGRRAHGPVEFEWRQGDVRILVHRGWPDTTTYVVYEIISKLDKMQAGK